LSIHTIPTKLMSEPVDLMEDDLFMQKLRDVAIPGGIPMVIQVRPEQIARIFMVIDALREKIRDGIR
jgi:hypothetical protein